MLTTDPCFSIVIPVKNGERYIAQTIESILSQTYTNFRVLVLENGSKDRTVDLVHTYQDTRIQLIPAFADLTIEQNWARIVDLDLAEYLTILSHDDLLYPHFLEETCRLILSYPEASLYVTCFDLIDTSDNIIRRCYPIPEREDGSSFLLNLHQLREESYATGYVMRSADYQRIGGIPLLPDLMFADHLMVYRLSLLGYKACSQRPSFAYRQHEQSASHVVNLDRIYEAAKQYCEALDAAGYLSDPDHRLDALHYVSFLFNAHYHRILVGLIASDDPAAYHTYQKIRAAIWADHREKPLFPVYDRASQFYEWVVSVRPRLVRRLLYQLILTVRTWRRKRLLARLEANNR
jgi:glycosyltransferase involved in cell wall biosynthesis